MTSEKAKELTNLAFLQKEIEEKNFLEVEEQKPEIKEILDLIYSLISETIEAAESVIVIRDQTYHKHSSSDLQKLQELLFVKFKHSWFSSTHYNFTEEAKIVIRILRELKNFKVECYNVPLCSVFISW